MQTETRAYATDEAAFEGAVECVSAGESECDTALRDLRTVVADSTPPNYTDVFLRIDDVARLFAAIDGVPNRAERFVRELQAIAPRWTPTSGRPCARWRF